MAATYADRFDRIDMRFDRVDERFDRVDARFDRVDERLDRMDARFDRMDASFDGLRTDLGREIAALRRDMHGFMVTMLAVFGGVIAAGVGGIVVAALA